jgi:hypothetical protein
MELSTLPPGRRKGLVDVPVVVVVVVVVDRTYPGGA